MACYKVSQIDNNKHEISVVKVGLEGESEKASGHGSTRSNSSNRWLNQISVETECEAVDGWTGSTVQSGPVLTTLINREGK